MNVEYKYKGIQNVFPFQYCTTANKNLIFRTPPNDGSAVTVKTCGPDWLAYRAEGDSHASCKVIVNIRNPHMMMIIIIIIVNIYNAPCLSKMTLLAQLCENCINVGIRQSSHVIISIANC